MRSAVAPQPLLLLLILTFCSFSSFNVGFVAASESSVGENTFTPKGYLMRYWKKQISNDLLKPEFLLEKASPLSASQYAVFSKLADQLPDFCSKANLLCFPDLKIG
ncbi:hypothetical protein ACS0TY_033852 [Phlomoides rotata]